MRNNLKSIISTRKGALHEEVILIVGTRRETNRIKTSFSYQGNRVGCFIKNYGRVIDLFRKITTKEQLRKERAKRLEEQNKRKESEKIILEQLIDVDFRQSMIDMEV